MLTVKVYPDADSIVDGGAQEFHVDFVSLINNESYGPPALVAPAANGRDSKRATPGEEVFYINTSLVPAFSIVEDED